MFRNPKSQDKMTEKEMKYFTCEYQKVANLGNIYLLPKYMKGYQMVR